MNKKLDQIIQEIFPEAVMDYSAWQSVLDQCKNHSVFHLFSTVRYFVSYFLQSESINLSMVLYNRDIAVGVMPLMIHKNEHQEWVLSSNGIEIVEPVFIERLSHKYKKNLESKLYNLIENLPESLEISQCKFVNMDYIQLSSWYLMCSERAKEAFSTYHSIVDLSLSVDEIHLRFRRSYKTLINKGLREWNVEIHEQVSDKLFEKFRLLHKKASGGSTRPIESWQEQKRQIDSCEAILITVSDKYENLVGAGFFTYSKYQGLYCVAAYERDLFNKPLGHAIQMKIIETLKDKGVVWYEIGQKHLNIDRSQATDKELSISHFKEGFATHVIARQHLLVDFSL